MEKMIQKGIPFGDKGSKRQARGHNRQNLGRSKTDNLAGNEWCASMQMGWNRCSGGWRMSVDGEWNTGLLQGRWDC